MSKKNIIIINPDEMRWDTMGHMGNVAAHTPNLDTFSREEAVSFSNAYSQNPVCVPSRCSFLTGLYPHVNGHRTMYHLMQEHEDSLFSELKDDGYFVWMNARNDFFAAQYPELVRKHSDVFHCSMPSGGRPHKDEDYSHFHGLIDASADLDWKDTKAACDFIRAYDTNKPLCLFLGLLNPHVPYQVEEEYRKLIDVEKIEAPVRYEDAVGKSRMLSKIHENVALDEFDQAKWKEIRAVYLAQCAKVDVMFKMVCDALKEKGMYDDSAIFVLSDHGDYCGDFGLPEKSESSLEDCLLHVPFLIKPPKGESVDCGISDSLVELVDFYATAMDYAKVKPKHTHFGRSLREVIADRNIRVRDYVFSEGGRCPGEEHADGFHAEGPNGTSPQNVYWPKLEAQLDDLAHEKVTAIYDGRYKYIHRSSGECELYDHASDPKELVNIYKEHIDDVIVLKKQRDILNWYQNTCDIVPFQYDNRFTEDKIWSIVKGMCGGNPEKEEKVKAFIHEKQPALMAAIGFVFSLKD